MEEGWTFLKQTMFDIYKYVIYLLFNLVCKILYVCIYMCVCICAFMCVCIYIYIYIYIHILSKTKILGWALEYVRNSPKDIFLWIPCLEFYFLHLFAKKSLIFRITNINFFTEKSSYACYSRSNAERMPPVRKTWWLAGLSPLHALPHLPHGHTLPIPHWHVTSRSQAWLHHPGISGS